MQQIYYYSNDWNNTAAGPFTGVLSNNRDTFRTKNRKSRAFLQTLNRFFFIPGKNLVPKPPSQGKAPARSRTGEVAAVGAASAAAHLRSLSRGSSAPDVAFPGGDGPQTTPVRCFSQRRWHAPQHAAVTGKKAVMNTKKLNGEQCNDSLVPLSTLKEALKKYFVNGGHVYNGKRTSQN